MMPPDIFAPDAVAPDKGNQALNDIEPELDAAPFTQTWIIGPGDGAMSSFTLIITDLRRKRRVVGFRAQGVLDPGN